MARTPEQKAADEALTEAIERAFAAYFPDDERGILMEYAIVGSCALPDEDEPSTRVFQLIRDDGVPHHRLMGLFDYSLTRLRSQVGD